jgi:hypothetical protein
MILAHELLLTLGTVNMISMVSLLVNDLWCMVLVHKEKTVVDVWAVHEIVRVYCGWYYSQPQKRAKIFSVHIKS